MSVNEKMTAIADAIREQTNKTGLMNMDEMAAAIKSIAPELWGGKMITGSFTLAEDNTGEYVIATATDDVIKGLLNEGETYSSVYPGVALMVMRDATTSFNAADYPNTLGSAFRIITKRHTYHSVRQYWDSSGSSYSRNGGTTVNANKIAITFDSGCAGSAAFTYNWVAWRHI